MTGPAADDPAADDPAGDESLYERDASGVGLAVVLAVVVLVVAVVVGGGAAKPSRTDERPSAAAAATTTTTTTTTTAPITSTSTTTSSTTTTTSTTTTSTTTTTTTAPPPAVGVSVADIDAAVVGYLNARLPGWTISYLGPRSDITGWADPVSRILYVYVRPDRSAADHAAVIRHQIDVIAASSA